MIGSRTENIPRHIPNSTMVGRIVLDQNRLPVGLKKKWESSPACPSRREAPGERAVNISETVPRQKCAGEVETRQTRNGGVIANHLRGRGGRRGEKEGSRLKLAEEAC